MVSKVELPNSTQELHIWVQRQILRHIFKSILKFHKILAINVITNKSFPESITVEIQTIANGVVNIYLSKIISLIELFSGLKSLKTHRSPFCKSQTEFGIKHPCLAQQEATTPVTSRFLRLSEWALSQARCFRQDGLCLDKSKWIQMQNTETH
jgi:hypothetical protein